MITDHTWLAVWNTRDGKKVRVGYMATEHILNCIRMLQKRIDHLDAGYPQVYTGDSDAAADAVECENRACENLMDACREWIELFESELQRRQGHKTTVKTFYSLSQLHDGIHCLRSDRVS
jgi:hypothetical protein